MGCRLWSLGKMAIANKDKIRVDRIDESTIDILCPRAVVIAQLDIAKAKAIKTTPQRD